MFDRRHILMLGLGAATAAAAGESGWRDVLDVSAPTSSLAVRGLFNGLAMAGSRVVAVGQRGHVLWSDDQGGTWHQAAVPVSSDLVGVHFPDPRHGWAVGHDAVVLRTQDGGMNWALQLDGRKLGAHLGDAYAIGTPGLSAEQARFWRGESGHFVAQGAENPLLDVWFDSPTTGWVVGAFGLALRTTDAGAHWQPAMHLMDNPKALHLYAVRRIGGRLCVVGEQGLVRRHDPATDRFAALTVPYGGTFFGVTGNEGELVVHGLRGNLLSSVDHGDHWQTVATGLEVGLTGSAALGEDRWVVVSQTGHVLLSDGASPLRLLRQERPVPAAAVASPSAGRLVIAGPRGLRTIEVR